MFGHISLSLCVYSAKDKVTVWNGILYFSDALHRPAQPGFFSQLGHLHFDLHFKEIGVGTTQAQLLIFRASVREAKILDPHHFTSVRGNLFGTQENICNFLMFRTSMFKDHIRL